LKNHAREINYEESWRRNHWKRNHGEGIMDGGGIYKRHVGGIWEASERHLGGIWEASGRHLGGI
jgi:hypothetical protein